MSGTPPRSAVAASLELVASERPELLDFHLEALLSSSVRLAVSDLADACDAPLDRLGLVIYKASLDLDHLEKRRGVWRDAAQVLGPHNVAALLQVCEARAGRAQEVERRRRLDTIGRKLESTVGLALSRAWIEDFIGPQPPGAPTSEGN